MFMNMPKRLFKLLTILLISLLLVVNVHSQDKTKLTIGTNYIIDVLNPTTSLYGYAAPKSSTCSVNFEMITVSASSTLLMTSPPLAFSPIESPSCISVVLSKLVRQPTS